MRLYTIYFIENAELRSDLRCEISVTVWLRTSQTGGRTSSDAPWRSINNMQ